MKQDSEELTEFELCLQIIIGSFCKKDATKEYIKGSARELLSIARQQIASEIDINAIWGRLVFRGVERLSREDVEEFVENIKKGK